MQQKDSRNQSVPKQNSPRFNKVLLVINVVCWLLLISIGIYEMLAGAYWRGAGRLFVSLVFVFNAWNAWSALRGCSR